MRRQVWGETFRWPLRFGGGRGVALALVFLVGCFALNVAIQTILARDPAWQRPVQKSVFLFKLALQSNPIFATLTIGLAVPIAEEILFRGLIFDSLRRWWRTRWVVPATAFLFALIHFDLPFLLPLFLFGLVLGWARARSGSLGLPIFVHALNNLVALGALKFAGSH